MNPEKYLTFKLTKKKIEKTLQESFEKFKALRKKAVNGICHCERSEAIYKRYEIASLRSQ